ncbi:unnamed protein product [Camellia sinensis]
MRERSFSCMDKEVTDWSSGVGVGGSISNCMCERQTPQCDAVGSTIVVAVVILEKIIVSNCGDSRAVVCRNGVAIPLFSNRKVSLIDQMNSIGFKTPVEESYSGTVLEYSES